MNCPIARRRFLFYSTASLGLAACGSNEAAPEASAQGGAAAPTAPPAPPVAPAPTPAPPAYQPVAPANGLPSLRVHASTAGTWPYAATLMPLLGQVPAGKTLISADDPDLRASVLSTWPDGSAAVMVAAGRVSTGANEVRALALQLIDVAALTEPGLGAPRIAQAVQSIRLDFGGTLGVAQLTDLSRPERVWWANAQTICARYRAAASGHASLEMVVDIQAFAGGQALVEVVVENSKMDSATPVKPTAASYSAATLSVNGSAVATVNAAGAAEGTHSAFRAWYASVWVGGDPGLRATQSHTELQQHPLLFQCDQTSTFDFSSYAADAYAPWSAGRHRASNMGGAGDHPSIGPLPQWEARALQSGDYRAWNATEESALAVLGFNVNYRDSGTGAVPTFAAIGARPISGGVWPSQGDTGGAGPMAWQVAHHPAAGLMAFVSRPSPVFIEIAQKVAVWNGTWSGSSNGSFTWSSGVFGYWYETRGKAWGIRSLAHAGFLTPNGDTWRTSCLTALANNVTLNDGFRTEGRHALNVIPDGRPDAPIDHEASVAGFQQAIWLHHYLAAELHKAASARLLSGPSQTALETLTDWTLLQSVRWVTEQPNGGWRYVPYKTTMGSNASTINSQATWALERNRAGNHTDSPGAVSGPWMSHGGVPSTYASYTADNSSGAYYPSYFWATLVAAMERNVPGVAQAWATVNANITNLSSWRGGFASDPRWGATPRNL